ncbi:MAG: alpha/beta hydrolase [Gammaproteobacteria bacterium]|jgi:non-heme chloroperoxidase|nr:alpha/beta hydrolase [Gammaproteobacteria bacterium]MBT4494758.1 alpha/beta hydrolase [Gammaproteobacteria bacterium]MBT7371120.1 alpha/beta hydrolase [Gammaproteobacteria bacterium]
MSYLEVPEGRVYYEFYPGTRRTCVVLAHGFGMNCRVWDHTVAVLMDTGFAVLVYDQRCCGQSDKHFTDVSIATLGDDLVNICQELNLESIVLNGWSLGGAIVVDAAAKLEAQLAGLVLTGGATPRYTQAEGFPFGGSAEDVAATVAALRADRPGFLHGLYYDGVFATEVTEETKAWCLKMALEESPAGDAALGALASLDQRNIMGALKCPALIMHGDQDGVVPVDIGRYAAELLEGARLHEMSGCGHAPFLENKEEYHQQLLSFLAEVSEG